MPIQLDKHTPEVDLTPGTTKSDIVILLYENPKFGYKPSEIQEILDIPRGTATGTLKRLYEHNFVGKTSDGYYHALADRDDLFHYLSSVEQLHRLHGHHRKEESVDNDSEDNDQTEQHPSEEVLEAELQELEAEIEDTDD